MKCTECGEKLDPKEMAQSFPRYYEFPYNYGQAENDYCLACWLGVGPNDDVEIAWDEDVVALEFDAGPLRYWVVPGLVDQAKVRADLELLDEALGEHARLIDELGREYARIRDVATARVEEVFGTVKKLLPPIDNHIHAQGRVVDLQRTRSLLEEHVTAALREFQKREFLAWWELFGDLEFEVVSCTAQDGFDDWRLHECIRERYPNPVEK